MKPNEIKLKTLKDFYFLGIDGDEKNTEISGQYVEINVLKQEAIKWVKHIKPKGDIALWSWIIRFFNLTSEDLK